jgi:hypothetical protein
VARVLRAPRAMDERGRQGIGRRKLDTEARYELVERWDW